MKKETATFGMGCFWGVELLFSKVDGVVKVESGYMGGDPKIIPNYDKVCSDKTGYAEVVQMEFDPDKVSYEKLLDIFWKNHDPTTINRQGHDIGTQYRGVIFYHNEKQKIEAEKSKKDFQKNMKKKIVTEIVKAGIFFRAEDYHQRYLEKRGLTSCHINY